MALKQKVFYFFLFAGFIGGLGATVFLWNLTEPDNQYVVLGFRERWIFYTFPFVGALLSGFWAFVLLVPDFGAMRGAFASLLAFLTFILVLGLLSPAGFGGNFPVGVKGILGTVFAFTVFGFVMFGWALIVIGALAGWLFKRSVEKHSNNAFNSDAQKARAG